MHLRFSADRRTLVWAFFLFPLLPALALMLPRLVWALVPLALYTSYCAGVLTHNHTHVPLFRERRYNRWYANYLSFFYGCPIFTWIPTHHANHHRYVNGDGDYMSTRRYSQQDSLWAALSYPLRSSYWQLPHIRNYVLRVRRRGGAPFVDVLTQSACLVGGHFALLALFVRLHGAWTGGTAYLFAVGLPAALAPAFMMITNYLQHVGCDPLSPDNHSRNFTSKLFNYLTFDNGLHSVHHEHPALHWSQVSAVHAERAPHILPDLKQRTLLGYCLNTYLIERLGGRVDADVVHSRTRVTNAS